MFMMDKWDAQVTLALIERHRVTHTHMVATMFHRILGLPENIRSKYDLTSFGSGIVHRRSPGPTNQSWPFLGVPDREQRHELTQRKEERSYFDRMFSGNPSMPNRLSLRRFLT